MTALIDQITSVLAQFDDQNLQSEIDSISPRLQELMKFRDENKDKAHRAFGYYSGMFAAVGGKGWYHLLTENSRSMIVDKLTKKHNATVLARNTKIAKNLAGGYNIQCLHNRILVKVK